jgi:hypothetical protein
MMKPETGREVTSMCSGRTTRGGRGQRASTDQQGTWETRTVRHLQGMEMKLLAAGTNNHCRTGSGVGGGRSSDEAG